MLANELVMSKQREANAKWHIKSQYDPKRHELSLSIPSLMQKSHTLSTIITSKPWRRWRYRSGYSVFVRSLPCRQKLVKRGGPQSTATNRVDAPTSAGPAYGINKLDLNKIGWSGLLNISKAKMPNLSTLELSKYSLMKEDAI